VYEAVQAHHGIMILGDPMTGKTTLLRNMNDIAKILNKMEFNKR